MKIFINYEGVTDHLDILSKEAAMSRQLMAAMQRLEQILPGDNPGQAIQLREMAGSLDSFQRNIQDRRELLLNIVSEFKAANYAMAETVSGIGEKVAGLSDREEYG